MKKILLSALALAALTTTVSAKSFNEKLHDECLYVLGDRDEGRYDEEAHGYSLGVISGIKAAAPTNAKKPIARKSLGYLSDKACLAALRDKSRMQFIHKYQKAALNLLLK